MRKRHPSSQSSSKNSRTPGERHLRVRSVRRDKPDLQRIAGTISDLIFYLARTGRTLDQHQASMAKHREIARSLRRSRTALRPGQPLPGCDCRDCTNFRSLAQK